MNKDTINQLQSETEYTLQLLWKTLSPYSAPEVQVESLEGLKELVAIFSCPPFRNSPMHDDLKLLQQIFISRMN